MATSPFLLDEAAYQREVSPMQDWIAQTAMYASKTLNKPYEACIAHLQHKLRIGELKPNVPLVIHYERGENGDTFKTTSPLTKYFKDTVSRNEILAPTGTTYAHPSEMRSVIVNQLDENVALRKKYKKLAQKYEAEGNILLKNYFHQMQDCAKRANNSVSGGFVAGGSVINNPSAHSTLTSTTRSIASLSNASNERLIEGNRHYFTPDITLYNLISILSKVDRQLIDAAIAEYGLVYPTHDETIACIQRSTSKYWRDRKPMKDIEAFVHTFTATECAAVVYTGDLYHLRHLNPYVIRQMVSTLAKRGDATSIENPKAQIYATDEMVVNYAHQVNVTMMGGKGKDYDKLTHEEQCILANTCSNIISAIETYRGLIAAFFLTKNSPCTIATIPTMLRETVVLSDTDSTMFAVDNWVDWYFGGLNFSDDGYAIAGAVMYMATQAISHILALFSANMNVERQRLFTLAMKPEFVFPVFAQTSVAKHYYTARLVKEGNVFSKPEMEIKGVHMKDSAVPTDIIESAAQEMKLVIDTVMRGDLIDLQGLVDRTIKMEHDIIKSLFRGETKYLKRVKIKEAGAYKKGAEESPYQYYTLWEEAFAASYTHASKPPYAAVRLPLDIDNKTDMADWLASIQDDSVRTGISNWMLWNKKVMFKSFPIPEMHCLNHGVPKELRAAMNARKIVLALTKSYRNTLESLGYYSKQDYLVSELYGVPLPT